MGDTWRTSQQERCSKKNTSRFALFYKEITTADLHLEEFLSSRSPCVLLMLISCFPRVPSHADIAFTSHWSPIHLVFSSCSLHAQLQFNLALSLNFYYVGCLKEWEGLKHGCNQYLNFPACVWTVTENPKTPNVFLQVQNTEYLENKRTQKQRVSHKQQVCSTKVHIMFEHKSDWNS